MINLYQDPDGNRIFSNKDTQLQVVPISHVHTLGVSSGNCIQGKQLQTKVEDLEKHLSGVSECDLKSKLCQIHHATASCLLYMRSKVSLKK